MKKILIIILSISLISTFSCNSKTSEKDEVVNESKVENTEENKDSVEVNSEEETKNKKKKKQCWDRVIKCKCCKKVFKGCGWRKDLVTLKPKKNGKNCSKECAIRCDRRPY
jgi:hypothetical protein